MNDDDGFRLSLTSEKLRKTYDVWREWRGDRIGPRRDEVAPAKLRAVLSSTFMIDVVDGGKDFRFRFAGERVIQFMGRRLAGSLLSEQTSNPFFERMRAIFSSCVSTKAPVSRGPV